MMALNTGAAFKFKRIATTSINILITINAVHFRKIHSRPTLCTPLASNRNANNANITQWLIICCCALILTIFLSNFQSIEIEFCTHIHHVCVCACVHYCILLCLYKIAFMLLNMNLTWCCCWCSYNNETSNMKNFLFPLLYLIMTPVVNV